ncbi:MAG TPA: ABC transporter substrate-binding protein [Acidimicrobiales bacterium]|nr:ABC transporter substrate-binding protein [Acidimicrobiales bacterium]
MKRQTKLLLVSLISAALIAAACGDDGDTTEPTATTPSATAGGPTTSAANTASDTGVTATEIKVAIHAADLSGLIKAGVIKGVPEDAHTANALRISYYLDKWNAENGINGRKFVYELITWDPADPKTYQTSCQKVIDAKVFMVISSGGGFPADSTPCITNEGNTIYMALDALSAKHYKDAGGNLIGLSPPGAASAQAGTEALVKSATALPKATAKVAVLRGDWDFQTEAFNETDKILKREGYSVVFSEAIKVANLSATDSARNVALSVVKVKAAGATHVINMLPFTQFGIFPTEATKSALTPKYLFVDISSGMCQTFTASQLPQELDGALCLTHWNNMRWDTAGNVAKDTPFEAQCRLDYEATYKGKPVGKDFPVYTKSNPGVSYPGIKDATGKQIDMDQSYYECSLMQLVKAGIEGAGGNLTKKTFQDALYAKKDFEAAGLAGGKGTIEPNKPWLASSVHQIVVTTNPTGFAPGTTADAKGLYNGKCPSPLGCWRTVPNTTTALTYKLT